MLRRAVGVHDPKLKVNLSSFTRHETLRIQSHGPREWNGGWTADENVGDLRTAGAELGREGACRGLVEPGAERTSPPLRCLGVGESLFLLAQLVQERRRRRRRRHRRRKADADERSHYTEHAHLCLQTVVACVRLIIFE